MTHYDYLQNAKNEKEIKKVFAENCVSQILKDLRKPLQILITKCYEPLQKLRVRLWPCKTGLSPPVTLCY